MESFKTIEGFEDYEVSNFGRVRTKSRPIRYTHAVTGMEHFRTSEERFLKIYLNDRTGYKFVQLYKDKRSYNRTIHRLVADAFISRGDETKVVVNHKDGNKHNNIVDNLEWCTNQYNHEHATKTGLKPRGSRIGSSKLTEESVEVIKRMLADNVNHGQISKWFKVSRSTISLISEGKTWNSLTGTELTYKVENETIKP